MRNLHQSPAYWPAEMPAPPVQVLSVEQRQVLERRGGAVLSRRSILKTAAPRPTDMEANALRLPGVADIRYWSACHGHPCGIVLVRVLLPKMLHRISRCAARMDGKARAEQMPRSC
jgi:hypothetical protein